jgi:hypothetical protein
MSVVAASSTPPTAGSARDDFIDLCRAFSLLIVVMWHWVFTIVGWRTSGPSANSPLGFTDNLWILTWFLQVMPLFFFVGGYAHLQLWTKLRGGPHGRFVLGRLQRLLLPSLALLLVWVAIATVVNAAFHVPWFGKAALLIVSPLWFIAVYLVLVVLAPITIRLHQRFGPLVVVWMAGLAALVDVLRFAGTSAGRRSSTCWWCGRCATSSDTSTGGSPTGRGRSRGALSGAGCSAWWGWCSPTSTHRRWWACPVIASPTWGRRPCASWRCAASRPAWSC